MERIRKVDINALDEETVKNIQEEVIKKITEINNKACEEANKILNIYGLCARMQMVFEDKE